MITRNLPGIAPTAPLECACMATECRSPEDRERALSSIGSRHRDKIRRGANGASEQDVPPAREETQLACGPSGQPDNTHQFSCACPRSAKLAGTLHEVETNSACLLVRELATKLGDHRSVSTGSCSGTRRRCRCVHACQCHPLRSIPIGPPLARPASAPVPVQCHAPANRRRNCRDLPAE